MRYQASNITYCNFKNSKLLGVDFVNTNLKYTNFKGAKLEEVILFNCNLKNVNFENVQFKKVFFISTNIKNAKNLNLDEGCVYINSYPKIELNTEILNARDKLKNCK
ncbi:pentapeptide repeat-containing protein [Intestinibacter bartlettii]|uniref:pentapeptide repeat-containing protein n=1 Tax=Intestinibacter bartlettii TaxID=261299 RepID=UPI00399F278E